MLVLETDRLTLYHLSTDDASFIIKLVNSSTWLRFIGDRGIKTAKQAYRYLVDGPLASYERFGFGLYLIKLKKGDLPIGLCGLIKRDVLNDPDIGFALLPEFTGAGYAYEAAGAVLTYAKTVLELNRVVAITTEENTHSINLLKKLGLQFENLVTFPDNKEFMLFGSLETVSLSTQATKKTAVM